ncbi:hypothetical protein OIU84_006784 [Salix udensis]|uniref:Dormancy/auxin associated family protein n=1 Tax=Salix udensis TaxID=889485 RepID=A0AAD6JZ50_9ROSI|nr:hypothetical protein OIU84_006784 [Salix udensis]
MSLLDQLWDDTVAGPLPESGLGKLRKMPSLGPRPNSGKESSGGVMRSYGEEATTADEKRVTRSIMIVRPPGYSNGSSTTPPASPAGSTPPVSPFSDVVSPPNDVNSLCKSRWMWWARNNQRRVLSVSKEVYIGCIREGNRGWTRKS